MSRSVQACLLPHSPKGAATDVLVGIFMERSASFFAALFGTMLNGMGYVPVSTKYEEGRIQYILDFSQPIAVLSYAPHMAQVQSQLPCIDVSSLPPPPSAIKSEVTRGNADGTDLAYVIFTSGTTGRPKGVMIEHHSVCNLIAAKKDVMHTTESDRVLQFFDVAFDGSVFDYFPTLCTGASLVCWTGSLDNAIKAAHAHSATVAFFTNSALEVVDSLPPSLRIIGQAGEALSASMVSMWAPKARFMNLYGPTETTVWSTWKDLTPGEEITIGKLVPGCPVYLMNLDTTTGQLVDAPAGQRGEICIGGKGLARGYLKDEARTNEVFVTTPHGRVYRSGDVGALNATGDICFRGRIDDQVKVRGVRIELQEIEQVVSKSHEGIGSACAVVLDQQVVTFVVTNAADPAEVKAKILEQAKKDLPSAAVPSVVLPIKAMPLTANGKVDKVALTSELPVTSLAEANEAINVILSALTPVYRARTIEYKDQLHSFAALVNPNADVPTLEKDAKFLLKQRIPEAFCPAEVHILTAWPKGRDYHKNVLRMDELLPEFLKNKEWGALYKLTIQVMTNGESIVGRYLDEVTYDMNGKRIISGIFVSDDPIPLKYLQQTKDAQHIHMDMMENYLKPGKHPFGTTPKASKPIPAGGA